MSDRRKDLWKDVAEGSQKVTSYCDQGTERKPIVLECREQEEDRGDEVEKVNRGMVSVCTGEK